jgi:tetratricopeptide (TPR) repeat protein
MNPSTAGDDATLTTRGIERGDARSELPGGAAMGRYVLLGRIGSGGMGVVYAAYDPELDRKVALKLLHAEVAGDAGQARFLREAQALAKLSHPNVVAVHDVGTAGGDVWIAMEFVVGHTLSDWLRARKRSWREILAVMRPVALGLAAAHAAGLVHRDVKPDNVMLEGEVSEGGGPARVRVMDFGLARGSGIDESATTDRDSAGVPSRVRIDDVVTRVGAILGTPAYMAPEQFRGYSDVRSDQFSLCVMLWEALWGQRPFGGGSIVELGSNICEGNIRSPPRRGDVPRWLHRVVLRGLEVQPARRWPSMEALLGALDRGRRLAAVRRVGLAVAVVGLLGTGALVVRHLDEQRRIGACEEAGAVVKAVWGDEAAAEARVGLLASGAGHAQTTADRVAPWLDARATALADARAQVCRNAEVERIWDADMAARAQWCVEERHAELEALVDALASADERAVTNAVEAAAALRGVDPCLDATLLARLPEPPMADRDEVAAVQRELARAGALEATGAYDEGLLIARESLARAEALAWPPLVAAAGTQTGRLLFHAGAYAEAETVLTEAYFEAARANVDEQAFAAASYLTVACGELGKHAEGERWSKHADVVLGRLPDPARAREATQLGHLALVLHAKGEYQRAEALHEEALAIWQASLGADHPRVAGSLLNLGLTDMTLHRLQSARARTERALQLREQALGSDHPRVAETLDQLAGIAWKAGAYDEARVLLERALQILEVALGPEHPQVGGSLNNLANVAWKRGERERAKALFERSLAIAEKTLPEDHPDLARGLNNLGAANVQLGEPARAKAMLERALALREKVLGRRHLETALTLTNLADAQMALGASREAGDLYQRALAIQQEALGPDHVAAAGTLLGMVRVSLEHRRPDEAVALAERALAICEKAEIPGHLLASARFHLATALRRAGRDPARAVALAEQARDGFREAGDTVQVSNVESWLRERRGR